MEQHHHEHKVSKERNAFWGILIILLGFLFLFDNLDMLDFGDLIHDYWPVILIVFGVYLLIKKDHKHRISKEHFDDKTIICDTREANYSNTFGDMHITISSKNFQSGRISNVFGDMKIDLENLDIEPGESNLHLSGVFGDIIVAVPKNIAFMIRANITIGDIKIMGSKDSGFSKSMTYKSEGFDTASKKLNIIVSHVVGDIKIW